jgi:hypothetical protein
MRSNGFKLRTGSDGNRFVFTVNTGYTITGLKIYGVGNYALADDKSEPCYSVTKVEVDGAEITSFTDGTFPAKGADNCGTLTLTGISATASIAVYFDNSNAKGTQINACFDVDWSLPDSDKPLATSVSPTSATVAIGKTVTLTGEFTGGTFEGEWVSSDPSIATVSNTGVVTGVEVGNATITYQWKDDQSQDAYKASAEITVVEGFIKEKYSLVKGYDFTTWGSTTLAIESTKAGDIWNQANSKTNPVYFCTNTGLEKLAIQAVFSSNKGWKIDSNGLLEGSGAGRCAAIAGIEEGDVVEFNHNSGTSFYTKSDGTSDSGIKKETLLAESNHHVFKAEADGMIGFELTRGKYIYQINIYKRKPVITTAKEYTTYVTGQALDFSAVDGLKAYVATSTSASSVTLEEVTTVPAATPLVLIGKGTFSVPVAASASAPATNLLKAGPADLTGDGTEYVLSDGVFHRANAGSLAEGKAYLKVVSEARDLNISFGEATAIKAIENGQQMNGNFYNLAGQRVSQPTKGLYIVNGRKVVMK